MDILWLKINHKISQMRKYSMNNAPKLTQDFSTTTIANSLSNQSFHLILYPTEQCNFRCVYCYEDFEIGKMPDWLINATKKLISKKIKKINTLNLSWFGGEPLLAKDILFDMAEYAQNLSKKNNCKVSGDITTNGLLLDIKTLTRLVELKQNNFQISIDGDKEYHDTTRLTRTGKGTFNKIWQRLIDASKTSLDFKIIIRVHITALNQKSILEFCERYVKSLSSDNRFKLFFKAIENLGGENAEKHISNLTSKKSAKDLVAYLSKTYGDKCTNNNIENNYICYASKPNSLAIRANGNLNKCTVALSDERNNIGKINPDGTLIVNNQNFSTWIKGFTTLDSWQMGCPLSYMNNNSTVGDIQVKKVG